MVPRSKSFTVSSSNNDVKSMLLRTHSDIACQQLRRNNPSLLARAAKVAGSKKTLKNEQQDITTSPDGYESFTNSRWAPPTFGKHLDSKKDTTLQRVLQMESPRAIDSRRITSLENDDDNDGAISSALQAVPLAQASPVIPEGKHIFSKLSSPRSIRWDIKLAESMVNDNSSCTPSFEVAKERLSTKLGLKTPAFSENWWQQLDDVLKARMGAEEST